jgi:hypothetical protein
MPVKKTTKGSGQKTLKRAGRPKTASKAKRAPKLPRKRVEVYRAKDGFRFRAIAGNGRQDGASEEGKRHRTYVIKQVQSRYPDRQVVVFKSGTDEVEEILQSLNSSLS